MFPCTLRRLFHLQIEGLCLKTVFFRERVFCRRNLAVSSLCVETFYQGTHWRSECEAGSSLNVARCDPEQKWVNALFSRILRASLLPQIFSSGQRPPFSIGPGPKQEPVPLHFTGRNGLDSLKCISPRWRPASSRVYTCSRAILRNVTSRDLVFL